MVELYILHQPSFQDYVNDMCVFAWLSVFESSNPPEYDTTGQFQAVANPNKHEASA